MSHTDDYSGHTSKVAFSHSVSRVGSVVCNAHKHRSILQKEWEPRTCHHPQVAVRAAQTAARQRPWLPIRLSGATTEQRLCAMSRQGVLLRRQKHPPRSMLLLPLWLSWARGLVQETEWRRQQGVMLAGLLLHCCLHHSPVEKTERGTGGACALGSHR